MTFQWIGITLASFSIFGDTPWLKDMFIIPLKGFENSLLTGLKILVGILLGPLALFVFIEIVLIFSGSIYER